MNKFDYRSLFVFFLFLIVLSGCSSVSPVVKKPDGNYHVVGYGPSTQQSRNAALGAAADQCRKIKKEVVVISEDSRYTGLVSAEVNKAVKIASSIAKAAGETETSRTLKDASTKDSYETEVSFTCE